MSEQSEDSTVSLCMEGDPAVRFAAGVSRALSLPLDVRAHDALRRIDCVVGQNDGEVAETFNLSTPGAVRLLAGRLVIDARVWVDDARSEERVHLFEQELTCAVDGLHRYAERLIHSR